MSILATAPTQAASCSYRRSVDELKTHPDYDPADAALVREWENGNVSAGRVAQQLRAAGFQTSATIVKDHRRGECACRVDI